MKVKHSIRQTVALGGLSTTGFTPAPLRWLQEIGDSCKINGVRLQLTTPLDPIRSLRN